MKEEATTAHNGRVTQEDPLISIRSRLHPAKMYALLSFFIAPIDVHAPLMFTYTS